MKTPTFHQHQADRTEDFQWIIDETEVTAACNGIGFSPEVTSAFRDALPTLRSNNDLYSALQKASNNFTANGPAHDFRADFPMFFAFIFLASLPHVRSLTQKRKIDESVLKATLADMEIWIREYHRVHGKWGLDNYGWPAVYFSGRLFALGRLQFEIGNCSLPCPVLAPDGKSVALEANTPILSVHIPERGRLADSDCEKSFQWALDFFPLHFPEHHFKAFTCISWMMDPQLADYLPADSNLMLFLRRFQLVELLNPSDYQIWERVFGGPVSNLAEAPRDTALRRIVLTHAEHGLKWRMGGAYILRENVI